LISHYDADGCSAAGIVCRSLIREGFDVHASLMRNPFTQGLERIQKEDNELVIFTDLGSGQLNMIERFKGKSIILDHHQVILENPGENILQINANLYGINGNYEACGASLAYAFAMALNPNNKDLVDLALVGITGDKQYIGGIRGFNESVLDEAIENGIVTEEVGLKLSGDSLAEALYYSIDPYYKGISGDKQAIEELLSKLEIPGDNDYRMLEKEQQKKLHSALLFLLLKNGCEKNILDTVIRKRYWSENLHCEVEHFADLLDACGKGGNRGVALQLCLGDIDAWKESEQLEKRYKDKVLQELQRLEKEEIKETKSFRYFYGQESSLGGVIGGIATNFLYDRTKPLLSLVRKDDELHVSSRGNQYLVEQGLNLGFAMKSAAESLQGHGGGHKIAAGATIALNHEQEFLHQVDLIISKQIKI
jgi:RecJ-like exonuclease